MTQLLDILNPYDQSLLAQIPLHSYTECLAAIETAHRKWTNGPRMPKHARIAALRHFKQKLIEEKEIIIKLSVCEGGKPLRDTEVEFARALGGIDFCIEALGQMHGKQIPMGMTAPGHGHLAWTQRQPIGVILAYGAFNHPINLFIHQVIPAIALGAPTIYKPSDKTPLVALHLAQLLVDVGFDPADCQVILCDNDVASKLVSSPLISYFGFIGAAQIGWQLRSKLAPGVRCGLEHGGTASVVLGTDVDPRSLAASLTKAATYHSGQVCISTQHVYCPQAHIEQLQTELITQFKQIQMGDPNLADTEIGPLIHPSSLERIAHLVGDAHSKGARILCGGQAKGPFFAPTLLAQLPPDAFIQNQEVFGPVLCLHSYDQIDQVIAELNSKPFAFHASYFGNQMDQALHFAHQVQAGTVLINEHTVFRTDWMPFGGWKESGLGSGGFPQTLTEYSSEKLVVMKQSEFE